MNVPGSSRPPHDQEDLIRLVDEVAGLPREGLGTDILLDFLNSAAFILLSAGDRERAEALIRESAILAERIGQEMVGVDAMAAVTKLLDGDLGGVIDTARSRLEASEALGNQGQARAFFRTLATRPLCYLGKAEEALRFIDEGQGSTNVRLPPRAQLLRLLALAYLGRLDEATSVIDRLLPLADLEEYAPATNQLAALEAAVMVGHLEAVQTLSPRLNMLAAMPVVQNSEFTAPARHLGGAAALQGRYDEARAYYDQALEACAKIRFRPEIALIRLDLAELLLEHYPEEREAAIEHLDFAIAELREMKMQPALERALRHRGLLKA